jgi:hypothetical protein
MIPNWTIPNALALGNTMVLKPSERVRLSARRIAELLKEAGLPDGVLNIVHGDREVVEAICDHAGRGSPSSGRRVADVHQLTGTSSGRSAGRRQNPSSSCRTDLMAAESLAAMAVHRTAAWPLPSAGGLAPTIVNRLAGRRARVAGRNVNR